MTIIPFPIPRSSEANTRAPYKSPWTFEEEFIYPLFLFGEQTPPWLGPAISWSILHPKIRPYRRGWSQTLSWFLLMFRVSWEGCHPRATSARILSNQRRWKSLLVVRNRWRSTRKLHIIFCSESNMPVFFLVLLRRGFVLVVKARMAMWSNVSYVSNVNKIWENTVSYSRSRRS